MSDFVKQASDSHKPLCGELISMLSSQAPATGTSMQVRLLTTSAQPNTTHTETTQPTISQLAISQSSHHGSTWTPDKLFSGNANIVTLTRTDMNNGIKSDQVTNHVVTGWSITSSTIGRSMGLELTR